MEIICDQCGAVVPDPEWKTAWDGDIEHTYFLCPSCGEPYRVSTTDGKLRRNIKKYSEMAARIKAGKCTEQFLRRAQKLKEENVKRSLELATEHSPASLLLKE